jgi:hypothetical protein
LHPETGTARGDFFTIREIKDVSNIIHGSARVDARVMSEGDLRPYAYVDSGLENPTMSIIGVLAKESWTYMNEEDRGISILDIKFKNHANTLNSNM